MPTWKDDVVYSSWKAKNAGDSYSNGIFTYCEKWASLMEAKLAQGAKLVNIAKDTSHEADEEGITGYMYGMAVAILVECWVHGEALRKWHNNEYDVPDAKGTVNPALLSIECK